MAAIEFEERDLDASVPDLGRRRVDPGAVAVAAGPADGRQRPDPHRGEASATDPAGPDRTAAKPSLLPVRRRAPGDGHRPVSRRAHGRGPHPPGPGRGGAQHHGVRHAQRGRHLRSQPSLPRPGRTDAVPRRGRPGRHGPPRPADPAPGPHGRVEFDQRQLPTALGLLAGPSAPSVLSRRLRPDRPAPAGREVQRVAPGRAGPTGPPWSTRRPAAPAGPGTSAGWRG